VAILERTVEGGDLISLATIKEHLKVTTTTADNDTLLTAMVLAATLQAESYCGRDLRNSQYKLTTTGFGDVGLNDFVQRISAFNFQPISESTLKIRRATIATIDTVRHLVAGSLVTISADVFYATPRLALTYILLKTGQSWPTNTDDVEDNVVIDFTMKIPSNVNIAKEGIKRHVALMYEDRGDCEPDGVGHLSNRTSKQSGAEGLYSALLIPGV
tara:strand:- start:249 stop:893 length:645 start_codon:yes stop_codon:yes gene_type:complete